MIIFLFSYFSQNIIGIICSFKTLLVLFWFRCSKIDKNSKIIYGGSVNLDNCSTLLQVSGIEGLLIGGASLVYDKFVEILKITLETERVLLEG